MLPTPQPSRGRWSSTQASATGGDARAGPAGLGQVTTCAVPARHLLPPTRLGQQAGPAGHTHREWGGCWREGRVSGSWLSPVPRWVLAEAGFSFSAKAIHSLPPLLAHVGAVRPASHRPAIHQAPAVHWLLPTLWLQAGSWSLHAALLPALRAPALPLRLPLLQGGDVRVLGALPLPPPPLPRRGRCLPRL